MTPNEVSPQIVRTADGMDEAVRVAGAVIAAGGIVAFPTETFYGLAVRADDAAAVARLAALKERAGNKPIPLIAASRPDCERVARIPPLLAPLCETFWPGPLTLALEPTVPWPAAIAAGGKTIGVRVSSHPVARALAQAGGGLITATSANLSSKAPSASATELDPALLARVDLVVDGGRSPGGQPSTVVLARGDAVVVLRLGAISEAELGRVLGRAPLVA